MPADRTVPFGQWLCACCRGPRRLVYDLDLDPVGVIEERRVIALNVVWELLRRTLSLHTLSEDPLPAAINDVARRRLEGDMVDSNRVSVIGDWMSIRLLLSQPKPLSAAWRYQISSPRSPSNSSTPLQPSLRSKPE